MELTAEELKKVVHYDPDTGVFTWAGKPRRKARIGDVAGCVRNDGYVVIRVLGKLYLGHRLAWLYMTGRWPEKLLDHIDRNKSNCRWCNLRSATPSENGQNKIGVVGKSGVVGVVSRHGRFSARIKLDRIVHLLGTFDTAEEAHAAYTAAKRKMHPANVLF